MGVFLGRNCPNGSYPGWEFSLVGGFPGGNCPGGIIRVGIFSGESFPSTIHERALKIIYEDYNSSFIKELHRKDSSLT